MSFRVWIGENTDTFYTCRFLYLFYANSMIREYSDSCERCPLKDSYEAWAEDCQAIEQKAAADNDLQLVMGGIVRCNGFMKYGVDDDSPSGACYVNIQPPKINRVYLEEGSVQLASSLYVTGPPDMSKTRLTPKQ